MMKETYININEECDAIDELCVICLERTDQNKIVSVPHNKLLTCECECRYYVHPSCFDKWMANRPTEVSCLICLSKASPVLSCRDRVFICIRSRGFARIKRDCWHCFRWFMCFISLFVTLRIFDDNNYKTES
jgi:hypothetical protein